MTIAGALSLACSSSGPLLLDAEDRAPLRASDPSMEPDARDAGSGATDAAVVVSDSGAAVVVPDASALLSVVEVSTFGSLTTGLNIAEDCEFAAGTVNAPRELRCTGLFEDVAAHRVAWGARPYSPGTELWSDGADKLRWIYLPPGAVIDGADPDEWDFPVGTRFWKEFILDGTRIETRYFEKIRSDRWARGTYLWNEDATAATRDDGGHEDYRGLGYTVPSTRECDECHNGRKDRILGFELFGLAEKTARGVTLQDLLDEGRIETEATPEGAQLPEELDPKARAAVAWMHVNCGSACHNRSPDSEARETDLLMRLEYEQLRRLRPGNLNDLDPIANTVGIDATTKEWVNEVRVVPGEPGRSLLFRLVSSRGEEQMPPLVSNVVSEDGTRRVREWIESLAEAEE